MKKLLLLCFIYLLLIPGIQAQSPCNPPPGFDYTDAPIINCGLDGYTFRTSDLYFPNAGPGFCADPHNSQWIAFVADFTAIDFLFNVGNCMNFPGNQGLQIAAYEVQGDQSNPTCGINLINCYPGTSFEEDVYLSLNNLVYGKVYYLVFDGYSSDHCDYTINILNADIIPDPNPPTLSGPSSATSGSTHTFTFNENDDVYNPCGNQIDESECGCACFIDPDSWTVEWTAPPGSTINPFNTSPPTADITFGDVSGEVCVTVSNNCKVDVACLYVVVEDPVCDLTGIDLGVDCENAPLLCAEYLDGYCGTTLDNDLPLPVDLLNQISCNMQQPSWLRFSPCEDSVSLNITTGNCDLDSGIEMAIFTTDDCQNFNLIQDCIFLPDGISQTVGVGSLMPGATYHVLFSGQGDDICRFSIDILSGIHPTDPTTIPDTAEFVIREISPARIDGPDVVCKDELVTYTYIPPVCEIAPGNCDTLFGALALLNPYCPLPNEACLPPRLIIVDTFLVWHLPDGSTVIGDSTSYSIDVSFDPPSNCIDSVFSDSLISIDTSCMALAMIPDTGSGVFNDTIVQEIWVEIGHTFLIPLDSTAVIWIPSEYGGVIPDSFYWANPASQNVYCPCPPSNAICGSCDYRASRENRVVIEYRWWTEVVCEPDCYDFCGTTLCAGGQYWCAKECGYDIVNLGFDQPETTDYGYIQLCEWECFYLPANQTHYCDPGVYDIEIVDPISGCIDHHIFQLDLIWSVQISIDNVTFDCSPDNSTYTVSFDVSPSWIGFGVIVNGEYISGSSYVSDPIPSGDNYDFWVESTDWCPSFDAISGSYDCMPCTNDFTDLGTITVCDGFCYNYGGQDYCAPGEYLVPEPDGQGCVDTTRFEILVAIVPPISLLATETCAADNNSYTVTLDISTGPGSITVNGIPTGNTYTSGPYNNGDSYFFEVVYTTFDGCEAIINAAGTYDCMPCSNDLTDLGTVTVCEGDCYNFQGQDYCTAGEYLIPEPDGQGCVDTTRFFLEILPYDIIDLFIVSHDCTLNNSSYTVTLQINGIPPFVVNGDFVGGNIYTSNLIPDEASYTFNVSTLSACPSAMTISGSHDCTPCTADLNDLGIIGICPNDCYNFQGQDYCAAGTYDVTETDANGCIDTTRFTIEEWNTDVLDFVNLSLDCAPGNGSYTVSFEIIGTPPFLVNGQSIAGNFFTSAPIPDEATYSFLLESTGPCPITINAGGSHDCTPCTADLNDLGIIGICPNDCYNFQGQDYCAAGTYDVTETDANGCIDTTRFTIEEWNTDVLDFVNLSLDCAPGNGSYTVSFEIIGTPPFLVNGQSIAGNFFTSAPIPDEATYSFLLESTGPCPITINAGGSHDCTPCTADLNDLGIIGICPNDCYNFQGQDYCAAGTYDVTETDANGCIDTTRFTIEEWNTDQLIVSNISTDCAADSASYIVSFDIQGTPPFIINGQSFAGNYYTSAPIPDEAIFNFFIASTGPCPTSSSIAGSLDCTPCTADYLDLGNIQLCAGDCYPFLGQDYCDAGEHIVTQSDNEGCVDTTRFFLEFLPINSPSVSNLTEICDVTQTMYTISFTIYGTAPFFVNGQPIANNDDFYQSPTIFSGSPYYFEVMDSEPCATPLIIQGIYSCQGVCSITAGTLDDLLEYDCGSQTIKAVHDGNEVLGSDDLMEYVLYEGNDLFSGTVLAKNTDGVFPFNSSIMAFGEAYEMVSIVGNMLNGEVDLNDICLSVSNEVEVVYYEAPTLIRSQAQDSLVLTCADPNLDLEALFSGGSGQYNLSWTGNGLTWDSASFSANLPGIYRFSLEDAITGCTLRDSALVQQNKLIPSIEWAPIETLDCATPSIVIDATASSQGPDFYFDWSTTDGHFAETPLDLAPIVDVAGIYTLRVEDQTNGCIHEESITVEDLQDSIRTVSLDIESTLCEGQEDAKVEILAIDGGNPNYQYNFNGLDYGTTGSFQNLQSGSYPLVITDAKGCTYDTLVEIERAVVKNIGLPDSYHLTLGESLNLDPNPNFPITTIQWLNANGELMSDSMIWDVQPQRTSSYEVVTIDEFGCETRQSIMIRVSQPDGMVFVPNAFSPNGDLVNDELLIFSHPSVSRINFFHIFSRWGDMVHSCENVIPDPQGGSCGWDGTLKGKRLDPAVFVYLIEIELIDGTNRVLTGDITLLR